MLMSFITIMLGIIILYIGDILLTKLKNTNIDNDHALHLLWNRIIRSKYK